MTLKHAILGVLLSFLFVVFSCHGGIDIPGDASTDGDGDSDADGDSGPECPGGCPDGQFCQNGRCVSSCSGAGECPSPYVCCDNACVNTREDPYNCGSCGNTCAPYGDTCIGSICACNGAMACTPPYICCGTDGCVDSDSDNRHCGACGIACDGNCAGGACETCSPDPHEATGGNTCADAEPLGDLADTGDQRVLTGNLYPDGDQDCYWFTAEDTEDTECDTFHVDIRFNTNPDDQFAIEVFRGSCESPECAAEPYTHYSRATDFISGTGEDAIGECPCRPEETEEGAQLCSDNTAVFRFCVVRQSGSADDCAWYEIEVSNGLRSTSDS
jgi:hypothetical protein